MFEHVCGVVGHAQTTNTSELNRAGVQLFGRQWGGAVDASGVGAGGTGPIFTVVNTLDAGDPASSVGSGGHWCALYNHGNRRVLYDTFARTPRELFPHWPGVAAVESTDNTDREQRSVIGFDDTQEDTFCGQACLAWLLLCRDSVRAAKLI